MRPSIFTKEVDNFITKNVGVLTYKEISKQIREKFNKRNDLPIQYSKRGQCIVNQGANTMKA